MLSARFWDYMSRVFDMARRKGIESYEPHTTQPGRLHVPLWVVQEAVTYQYPDIKLRRTWRRVARDGGTVIVMGLRLTGHAAMDPDALVYAA